jgi:hypothetical protein
MPMRKGLRGPLALAALADPLALAALADPLAPAPVRPLNF